MLDILSKPNLPFFFTGTLATVTLLASGIFAIAPYTTFLAPVAALSIGLPAALFVLSAVAIALSYKVINQNKKLCALESEKFKLALENKREIEELEVKNKDLNTITQVLRAQLSEKYSELSNMTKELRNLENIKEQKNDSGYYSRTDTPTTFLDSISPRSTLNKAKECLTSYKEDQEIEYGLEVQRPKKLIIPDTELDSLSEDELDNIHGRTTMGIR